MNTKSLTLGLLALALATGLGVSLPRQDASLRGPAGPQGEKGEQGASGPQGPAGASANLNGLSGTLSALQGLLANLEEQKLSAVTGPDLNSPWMKLGGTTLWARNTSFASATTTVCSITSPAATSTLLMATAQIKTATTSALVLEIGRSLAPDATTTRLSLLNVAANKHATLTAGTVATSTQAGPSEQIHTTDSQALVFPPSSRLNVKIGGLNGATHGVVGSCNGVWVQS